jgi:hypothetical protein
MGDAIYLGSENWRVSRETRVTSANVTAANNTLTSVANVVSAPSILYISDDEQRTSC